MGRVDGRMSSMKLNALPIGGANGEAPLFELDHEEESSSLPSASPERLVRILPCFIERRWREGGKKTTGSEQSVARFSKRMPQMWCCE